MLYYEQILGVGVLLRNKISPFPHSYETQPIKAKEFFPQLAQAVEELAPLQLLDSKSTAQAHK